jgi:hypothetical protein
MPPFLGHDPMGVARAAAEPRWLVLLLATLHVAGEPWALAVLALAVYSWLEREVRAVVARVLPLAVALAVEGGAVALARAAAAAPRPQGASGVALAIRHLFPAPNVVAIATFAAYSLLVYRRRAVAPLAVAAAAAFGVAGRYAPGPLAAGIATGVVLAGVAFLGGGAVARGRRRARAAHAVALPGPGPRGAVPGVPARAEAPSDGDRPPA